MRYHYSFPTKLRVRYGETDQMGYCYYGNYAQYFEVGRVEALRALGMSYRNLEKQGVMLPVSSFTVKYLAPALYDDELTINTKITEIKGSRIYFEYEIRNNKDTLISIAETMLVFVNKENMRPTQAPDSFLSLIEPYRHVE
ncbi:MAG: acyl-CoA thioesterase [Flavobacteriia bacterium]|jgi:acyl-CoA thioester hydrolase